jgi:predicted ester cyclase
VDLALLHHATIISVAYGPPVTEDAAARRCLLARRAIEEIWTGANPSAIVELYDDAFVGRSNLAENVVRGPEEVRRATHEFVTAIANLRFEILDQITDGDTVATRWTGHGDGLEQLLEMAEVGDGPVQSGGITIHRFDGDRIVESWTYWDATSAPAPPRTLRLLG